MYANHEQVAKIRGSFSIYEQPKWERIVASTQVGLRVSIWVRIRIRVWIRVRVRVRIRIRIRVRLGLYFGCSYIEKGTDSYIGKTDRCLYTHIKERISSPNSEIDNRIIDY